MTTGGAAEPLELPAAAMAEIERALTFFDHAAVGLDPMGNASRGGHTVLHVARAFPELYRCNAYPVRALPFRALGAASAVAPRVSIPEGRLLFGFGAMGALVSSPPDEFRVDRFAHAALILHELDGERLRQLLRGRGDPLPREIAIRRAADAYRSHGAAVH
ncbi:hypothetical protein EMQ25_00800 [Arsenicitalea aurantiaca]|uniref:Uncharacterized protein n=1 Tax=Arsenicitalea aurantiaca TaxID=1783274 RepID=A0A433XKJ2_9HYPH|nr:hypothetical protein [Arsenicitalea aurantiaca]RUT34534.1 hypothetical protein EMQ25_00800 [Arsenicitalea aurantiaca]